jgi:hypothetical protein
VNTYDVLFYVIYVNADKVPQAAMTIAMSNSVPSNHPHLPSIDILAAKGPMIQSTNAEKEPKKAIIDPNSGMKIDTATDNAVMTTRCTIPRSRFNEKLEHGGMESFRATASGDGIGVSSRNRISTVALSYHNLSSVNVGIR